MTQDEIIEMARQAGAYRRDIGGSIEFLEVFMLERFTKLATEREREACAKIVEENANRCGVDTVAWMLLASNAQAIRARGQA